MLTDLKGKDDNYAILRNKWHEVFVFRGNNYTVSDLALETTHFPAEEDGHHFTKMLNAAYDSFRRHIWNVMFIKCAKMYYSYYWAIPWNQSPTRYARETHYPNYPTTYLRGKPDALYFGTWEFYYIYFMIDGKYLSDLAAKELFMDDAPGFIINPKGLFSRDYVFKQFYREKPDFHGFLDITKNDDPHHPLNNIDPNSDNYVFTQAIFPS